MHYNQNPSTIHSAATPFYAGLFTRSDGGSLVFEGVLDLDRDSYLVGHLVHGRPTLPGTFVLEMAAEAARHLVTDQVVVAFDTVLCRRLLRLHPVRKTAPFRIVARLLESSPSRSRVNIRVTSDLRAPSGKVLRADQVHFELNVVMAASGAPAARWTQPWPRMAREVPDPYLSDNPALKLSQAFDTLRETSVHDNWGMATLRLPAEAMGKPFTRFTVPVLMLDGLARTSVLALTRDGYSPLVALSSIGTVEIHCGNDSDLVGSEPIRLVSRRENTNGGDYRCAAVTGDGTVLATMRGVTGTLVGYVHQDTGSFVAPAKITQATA